jgi:hypothetical protein
VRPGIDARRKVVITGHLIPVGGNLIPIGARLIGVRAGLIGVGQGLVGVGLRLVGGNGSRRVGQCDLRATRVNEMTSEVSSRCRTEQDRPRGDALYATEYSVHRNPLHAYDA